MWRPILRAQGHDGFKAQESVALQFLLIEILEAQVGNKHRNMPQPEPRVMGEHFVMPSISSRDVARTKWPDTRRSNFSVMAVLRFA